MERKKFADLPKMSSALIQFALMIPTPFIFCYLAGYAYPPTLLLALKDIGIFILIFILSIPLIVICMALLKLLFYGSLMGTKRRVSLKVKHLGSLLFVLITTPPAAMLQAEIFLWMTERAGAENLYQALINGLFLFLASTPGIFVSLNDLKDKIALIKEKEAKEMQLPLK